MLLAAAAILLAIPAVRAQSLSFNSGQNVSPAYEGWEQAPDGTRYFWFGYMNRNWQEELDVTPGPENGFNVGGVDQGQPTHFLPRRNRFVFKVKAPAGFTEKDEMIWTLTTYGKTEKAYATLRLDYQIDDVVKASETGALGAGTSSPEVRANKAPVVKVQGAKTLTTTVNTADCARDTRHRRRHPEAAGRGSRGRGGLEYRNACRNSCGPQRARQLRERAASEPRDAAAGQSDGRKERRASSQLVCVPWLGAGDLRSPAADGVGRHPHRGELAVGAALDSTRHAG